MLEKPAREQSTGEYLGELSRGTRCREAHVLERCERHERNERREAVVLWVNAQQGSCNSFFLFSLLGLCANACGRHLWGLLYNCVSVAVCRVVGRISFALCLLLYMIALYMCY